MSSSHLRLRENWQTLSGHFALKAEQDFETLFNGLLLDTDYTIIPNPKDFNNIYYAHPLLDRDKGQIYEPERSYRHGFIPDFSITNDITGKCIYVELKRQDGWVEGKDRSAGRGNAHERSCKYFTPGLMKILCEKSGIHGTLPFWIVFKGDITRDPCRVREITCWFDGYTDNFFFWRDNNTSLLCQHFIECIAPHLE